MEEHLAMVAVGLFSIGLAQLLPPRWAPPLAGFAYFLIGPVQYLNGRYHEKTMRRALESERVSG